MLEHRIGPRHIIRLALLVVVMFPGSAESQDYQHEIDRLAGEVANSSQSRAQEYRSHRLHRP